MFKKIIGLVGLAGIVAVGAGVGCTVTTVETTTDSGTSPEASATTTTPKPDGGKPDAAPATCAENVTVAQIKAALDNPSGGFGPYKSTPPSAGQCSAADIAAYKAKLGDGTIKTYDQAIAALATISATCGACTYKAANGADWGPMITLKGQQGTSAIPNTAGCYESRGVSKSCAEAFHYYSQCSLVACNSCADADAFDECEKEVYGKGGTCADEAATAFQAACKADETKIQAISEICEKEQEIIIINLMTGACGPVSSDAGGGG